MMCLLIFAVNIDMYWICYLMVDRFMLIKIDCIDYKVIVFILYMYM